MKSHEEETMASHRLLLSIFVSWTGCGMAFNGRNPKAAGDGKQWQPGVYGISGLVVSGGDYRKYH
jgi:hypothetical protein